MVDERGQKRSSDGKRHLPIAPKIEVGAEGDEDRPPWHWSAIGAVAIFLAWLPLAFLAAAASKGALPAADANPSLGALATVVLLQAAAFVIACFGGGVLVGRFGARAGRKEATVSGAAAAAIAWALTVTQGARGGVLVWALVLAVLVGLGAAAARAGGALGLSLRKP